MLTLTAVPIRIESRRELYQESGRTVAYESIGYIVTFSVWDGGRLSGEIELPMQVPPVLGEEMQITIKPQTPRRIRPKANFK